jgi:hypothetical protein
LELVLRKTILASVHMRAHLQAEHMDASDLIVTNLQKDLASRGPSTYGRETVGESARLQAAEGSGMRQRRLISLAMAVFPLSSGYCLESGRMIGIYLPCFGWIVLDGAVIVGAAVYG